jgi:cell migration-inducing and hyaluronan-binding protein
MLSTSVRVGESSLELQDAVDWRVGETIVVASTSFDHYEAERRNILAINGTTITVDKPFKNLHFAGV